MSGMRDPLWERLGLNPDDVRVLKAALLRPKRELPEQVTRWRCGGYQWGRRCERWAYEYGAHCDSCREVGDWWRPALGLGGVLSVSRASLEAAYIHCASISRADLGAQYEWHSGRVNRAYQDALQELERGS